MSPLELVEVARASDVGRVRSHNEDRLVAESSLIAVADGMGGAQAGEVAAEMAVEALAGLPAPARVDDVRAAVEQANREIRRMAREDPHKAGMGTTMTAAMIDDGALALVHVGDSRAYLWRERELRQLTDDHSVVAEMVRQGSLAPEEAEQHPHRNVITRALGAEAEVQADLVTEGVREGDVVLLCSDGLSSYVPDAQIAAVLDDAPGLEAAAERLVEAANEAGGLDNITVVLARVHEVQERIGASTTQEMLLAEDADGHDGGEGRRDDTEEIPVIGGTRGRGAQEAALATEAPPATRRPTRVLQPVPRRRRRGPLLAAVGLVVLALVGTTAWVGSRTYTLAAGDEGTVVVRHGLPYGVLGLDLDAPWQDTGVPASAVRASDAGALSGGWHGQGEAVQLAAALVWRHGVAPLELPTERTAPVEPVGPAERPAPAIPSPAPPSGP